MDILKIGKKILHVADKGVRLVEPIVEKGVAVFAPEVLPEYEMAKVGYKVGRKVYGKAESAVEKAIEKKKNFKTLENSKMTVPSNITGKQQLKPREYLDQTKAKAMQHIPFSQRSDIIPHNAEKLLNNLSSKRNIDFVVDEAKPALSRKLAMRSKTTQPPAPIEDGFKPARRFTKSGLIHTAAPLPLNGTVQNADVSLGGSNKPGNAGHVHPIPTGLRI